MTRALPILLLVLVSCSEPAKAPVSTDAAPAGERPEPIAVTPPSQPLDTPVTNEPGQPKTDPESQFRSSADCRMNGRGEWRAHIDAMPGPGATPRLIVTGTILVKPAARTELRLDPAVLESMPPQRIVNLVVRLPSEPTIDMLERREVRGEWPVTAPLGAVHIRCGGRSVASVGDIVVAH